MPFPVVTVAVGHGLSPPFDSAKAMTSSEGLPSRILELAARQGDRDALVAPSRRSMSFGVLARGMSDLAAQLVGWGIGRGDAVAWLVADRAQSAMALAALPACATVVPIAASTTLDSLLGLLPRVRPKAVIAPAGMACALTQAASRLNLALLTAVDADGPAGAFSLALREPRHSLDQTGRHSADWAIIGATSGSTGKPKLVPLGHRQLLRTAFAMAATLDIGQGDVSGHVMPLHLSGGIRSSYFMALLAGGAVNVLPEADVGALLDAIAAGEVTFVSASFTMLREVRARLAAGGRYERGRLRFVRVASGRMEPGEMDELERLMDVPVVTGLGSSETGNTAQQRLDSPRRRGSVGPLLDSEVRLVDAEGRDVSAGEVGEMLVRSEQLCDGYLDDDELNAHAFADGWFRMGDLARFDEDGELHVVGRVKDVINRGGEKIAPLEIDAALLALPEVADAAAFAVPHPTLGEELVAAVVLAPGAPPQAGALLDRLRATLGARRTPRSLWFVASLPRGDGGKLRRSSLPAWVGYTAPATESARGNSEGSPYTVALGALWREVLGVEIVHAEDDFLSLGGDDAKLAALRAKVGPVFGVELPLVSDDSPATLGEMSRRLERAIRERR